MPVQKPHGLRKLTQREFGDISYSVMHHAFHIHSEMGCLFDESIYKKALKQRLGADARSEVGIQISFEDFLHVYFIDLLVDGAIFELKCAESIVAIHRAQLMNYLLLCDLCHGKLVNFGGHSLGHEFVNATQPTETRRRFQVVFDNWSRPDFSGWLTAFVGDLGTGLDVNLYEKAAVHYFGGEQKVSKRIQVGNFGSQKLNIAPDNWGLKITTLPKQAVPCFARNAERFLAQTQLQVFHWVNVGKDELLFRSVRR